MCTSSIISSVILVFVFNISKSTLNLFSQSSFRLINWSHIKKRLWSTLFLSVHLQWWQIKVYLKFFEPNVNHLWFVFIILLLLSYDLFGIKVGFYFRLIPSIVLDTHFFVIRIDLASKREQCARIVEVYLLGTYSVFM